MVQIDRLFEHWHRFRDGDLDRLQLQREMAPIQAELRTLVEDGRDRLPWEKVRGFCRDLLLVWPALWTFVDVAGVEPTNNAAERALRPAVLWRKGSFGSESAAGSRFAERLLTVVATCRQQGRRLLDFLVAVGEAALQGTARQSLLTTGPG